MKRTSFKQMNCSIARTLEVVGEWWSLLIVRDAFTGLRRFEDFQENLGIARNVLSSRLAKLVKQGILEKRTYQERPKRFEYRLTEKGADLYPVIVTLMEWGNQWACAKGGPPVVIVDRESSQVVDPVLIDGKTGQRLDPRRLRARAGPGASSKQRLRLGE